MKANSDSTSQIDLTSACGRSVDLSITAISFRIAQGNPS